MAHLEGNASSAQQKHKSKAKLTESSTPKALPVFKVTQALINARNKAFKTCQGYNASEAEALSPSGVFVKLRISTERLRQMGLPEVRTKWEQKVAQEKALQAKISVADIVIPNGQDEKRQPDSQKESASKLLFANKDESVDRVKIGEFGSVQSFRDNRQVLAETLPNQQAQLGQTGHSRHLNLFSSGSFSDATQQAVDSSPSFRTPVNLQVTSTLSVPQLPPCIKEQDLSSDADRVIQEGGFGCEQQSDWSGATSSSPGAVVTSVLTSTYGNNHSSTSLIDSRDFYPGQKNEALPLLSFGLHGGSRNKLAKRARFNSLQPTGAESGNSPQLRSAKATQGNKPLKLTTTALAILPADLQKLQNPKPSISTNDMAPVRDPNNVDSSLKDAIQKLYEVQSQVHGFVPETQPLLIDKMTELAQSLAHLQTLTSQTLSPNNPIHKNRIAPEVIDYVDDSRNPDIYNREFVELVQRGNAVMNGKQQAFKDFSEVFAKALKEGMPELSSEVDKIMENAKFSGSQTDAQKNKDGGANGAGRSEWKSEGRKEVDGETNGSKSN